MSNKTCKHGTPLDELCSECIAEEIENVRRRAEEY